MRICLSVCRKNKKCILDRSVLLSHRVVEVCDLIPQACLDRLQSVLHCTRLLACHQTLAFVGSVVDRVDRGFDELVQLLLEVAAYLLLERLSDVVVVVYNIGEKSS